MVAPVSEIVWTAQELSIFEIEGFEQRMSQIREKIQPKLRAIGERFSQPLSRLTSQPCYAHVAKHMRRTVNPPPETWVAFGPSARGYKQFCHYAFVVSAKAVHLRVVVKSEAPNRHELSERLRKEATQLFKETKDIALRSYWNWNFKESAPLIGNGEAFWQEAAAKLALKTGEFDVGIEFSGDSRSVNISEGDLMRAFEQLSPIHQTLR
ncbi:MAG: DUF1054 family protein [Blastocatellia bacterium]|nr:DUF1054 family protein [Blastocatellia bacterium]